MLVYGICFLLGISLGAWGMYSVMIGGMEKLLKDRVLVMREGLDND